MSDPREQLLLREIEARDAAIKESNDALAASAQKIKAMEQEAARMKQEMTLLREKLDALARRIFGKKSEQLDSNQLLLLLQEVQAPGPALGKEYGPGAFELSTPKDTPKAKQPARKPRLPEHLPVIEERIIPEAVQAAPELWSQIGEEVSERLDYEPARFLRLRTVRPKYVKRGEVDAVPLIAPLPPRILERSIVAPGLLAQIVVGKFCDHIPLYRQEKIYASRHQVNLPRQTMAEWMGLAADWLKPIYNLIRDSVLKDRYVQVDETPIRYLSPGEGKTKLGYLWTYCHPQGDVVFHWEASRAAACLDKVIPVDFCGAIQCDGYEAYQAFAKRRGGKITLAGCMAHVRRKFFDAIESAPGVAGWILHQIGMLYHVERRLRNARAGPRLREAWRASESRVVMERLHRALKRFQTVKRFLPQSGMGKAISYALNQWPFLLEFLKDGRIEIDNNLVENAIRPSAIGKKNWLFIGAEETGERSAILYTIIESCRKRDIDPFAYLRDVFTRLPTMTNWQVKEITPEAWAKAKRDGELRKAA